MSTRVVLIHGVGPFDPAKTRAKLLPVFERFGLNPNYFVAFDWCSIVGDPFDNLPAVGNSILRLPFLSSVEGANPGLSRLTAGMADYGFLMAQICAVFLLPFILVLSIVGSFAYLHSVLTLIVCFLAVGCAGQMLTTREFRVLVCLRRSVFVLIWPLLHTIATPAYLRVWRVLLAVGLPVASSAIIALIYTLFAGGFWSAVAGILSGLALYGAAIAVLYVGVRVTVYPVLKVFSDVIRWLGDAQYRDSLRYALAEQVKGMGISQEDTLVLATHSLGSVIGVDYLLSLASQKNCPRETILITCGSPLNFLLHSFIPELFCKPSALCQQLQRRIRGFRWINVYRPWDPIGRKLGIDLSSCAVEQSTKQWHEFIFAHVNYWEDEKVFASLQQALQRLINHETLEKFVEGNNFRWPSGAETKIHKPIVRFWDYGKQFSIGVLAAVLIGVGLSAIKEAIAGQADFVRLRTNGTKAVANATCFPKHVSEGGPNLHYRTDVVCRISFKVPGRSDPIEGERTNSSPLLPIEYLVWANNRPETCHVSVVYDDRNPTNFFIGGDESVGPRGPLCSNLRPDEDPWGENGEGSFFLLLYILILSGLTIFVWRFTGLRWSASLFGEDAEESWLPFYHSTIKPLLGDRGSQKYELDERSQMLIRKLHLGQRDYSVFRFTEGTVTRWEKGFSGEPVINAKEVDELNQALSTARGRKTNMS